MDFDKPKVYGDAFISDGLVLLYPPIFANLDFDIYFKQRPELSEQTLPHQWRFIYN